MHWWEIALIVVFVGVIGYVLYHERAPDFEYQGLNTTMRRRLMPRFRDDPSGSNGEKLCRRVLQEIYRKPFDNIRPYFLKSPKTGKNLELDAYNHDLKLAIEYQGPQHYKFMSYYHSTEKDFQNQLDRDRMKKEMCQKRGITLIEVPYTYSKYEDIRRFIVIELKKCGKYPRKE